MNQRWLLAILLLVLPAPLLAQDAHSFAIGQAATAAPMDVFGIYWNPGLLGLPTGGPPAPAWTIATGGSFFDTSNSGGPIFNFNSQNAMQSTQDPINRYQQYLGIFAVKFNSGAGGFNYDQELNYTASQSVLSFFNDRITGLASGSTYANLNFQQTTQQLATVILSYGMPLPFGTMPVFIGGSLKYQDGLQYQQTVLSGTYQQGNLANSYQYTKTSSTSGLGLSTDFGFFAKPTDTLQVGMIFQNVQSNFTWQGQQQTFALDPNTGAETLTSATNVTIPANFPYATKLGLVAAPPGKNIALEGEVDWTQGLVNWRFGLEHYYPENFLTVRLGTFYDRVSGSQLWTFGGGYDKTNFNIDLAFVTRSFPSIQDSISFGAALSALARF